MLRVGGPSPKVTAVSWTVPVRAPVYHPQILTPSPPTSAERREELKACFTDARGCVRCPQLASTRTQVVFGAGNADADLMFVGEAPGAKEDEQGVPFVGAAGKLLSQLLGEVGLSREDVFIANVLKCLRYNALVQLGDGSWERIGRLVRSRYAGEVMTVRADGELSRRRVTGWHETPLGGRRVFRVSYASAKQAGSHPTGVHMTGDHPVLTERGYVAAEALRPDDRIAIGHGLSEVARDVICGTLLGDGSLRRDSASLTMSHSVRQDAYVRFLADVLEELQPSLESRSVAAVAGGPATYKVVHLRTRAHRALAVLRSDFYGARKTVPRWVETRLNARMLAVWFMDDGYTRIRDGNRQPLAEIATNAFSDADRQVLLRGLRRLGLHAKASRRRLYFGVADTRRLSETIAPFVPPSMRYKLHPDVAETTPFDEALYRAGSPVVVYDRVVVEDVTDKPRADRTFFCIDVEETHNFVTSGGVVHNCRPPGNRDPAPVEIENCQEYLWRQIELIQPRVICTLGNFSTKLLRGDPTGISRIHGQPEIRVLGRRAVRLFPIYHPAAALYTRSMLGTLQEDFAKLPALLELPPPDQPEPAEPPAPEPEPEPAAELKPESPPDAPQLGLF